MPVEQPTEECAHRARHSRRHWSDDEAAREGTIRKRYRPEVAGLKTARGLRNERECSMLRHQQCSTAFARDSTRSPFNSQSATGAVLPKRPNRASEESVR